MNTTGIPAPAPAAPVAAKAPAAAPATPHSGDDFAGDDFVGMLMQLVAGSGASTASMTAVKLPATEAPAEDGEDIDALAALLASQQAVPPTLLPWAALPSTASDAGADPLEMLGLDGGNRGSDALLRDLTAELTLASSEPEPPAIDGDTANGVGSLSPFNETPQVRAPSAEAVAARTLHAPVGTDRWADELGSRVTMMVDRNQQSASLRLSPEHLGPLEVRISVTDDKASVWFGAAHADTRAAIEDALPRLREMLASQGLSLSDAGVFREPPRDQQPAPRTFGGASSEAAPESEVRMSTRSIGLLDAYA